MRKDMRIIIKIISVIFCAQSAHAAETPWQDVGQDTQIRLISTDIVSSDNKTIIGIELDMPASVHTYWRIPGETGIPPQFNFSARPENIKLDYDVIYPFPQRVEQSGYMDHVYAGYTIFPISITLPNEISELDLELFIGLCSDICIPVKVNFTLPMRFDASDKSSLIRLNQAIALAPIAWENPDDFGQPVLDLEAKTLVVPFSSDIIDYTTILADITDQPHLFSEPRLNEQGDALVFDLYGRYSNANLEHAQVNFTFMTAKGAYEVRKELNVKL